MNKLDFHLPSYHVDIPSDSATLHHTSANASLETVHRLIVLIPTDSDYTSATRRISDLAHASGAHVLFLGLCKDVTDELSLRRQLITLSALLQDTRVCVESKVESGTNWVEIVKSNYRDGDMIVCFAEQRTGVLHRPLSQILQSNLNAPVYILSGLYADSPLSNGYSQILAWSGSLGIIIGLFMLQVRLMSLPSDWVQTTLLILSVIAEAWLIRAWNSLFG